ncbi:hypothetical protein PMAYCL1PPCAC_25768, partial [Pristionchus mayeri]
EFCIREPFRIILNGVLNCVNISNSFCIFAGMTYRLLALALLIQVAWSCVPVRPGEDMPCPSTPEAASATGYGKKAFNTANSGGTKTLKCDDPAKLIKVNGGTPMELPAGTMLICK